MNGDAAGEREAHARRLEAESLRPVRQWPRVPRLTTEERTEVEEIVGLVGEALKN